MRDAKEEAKKPYGKRDVGKYFRPSPRFRLWQVFLFPWRAVCAWKGEHVWHKWACSRCLKVDEMRLSLHHVSTLLYKRRWWWEKRK